jgi:hypothetical protein
VGNVTQTRDATENVTYTMNDPRVSGTGTIRGGYDSYDTGHGGAGPEWCSYRLVNARGAWTGTVTGALWDSMNAEDLSGWLVGSGAYKGYTYYYHEWGPYPRYKVEGIIFPGSPPKP